MRIAGSESSAAVRRLTVCSASVGVAYLVCAISGLNRWTYIWLKAFYPAFVVSMWVSLVLGLWFLEARLVRLRWRGAMAGVLLGYIAGVIAYQSGSAIADRSLERLTSTIENYGLAAYVGVSATYPLLLLTWLSGLLAVVAYAALRERSRSAVRVAVYSCCALIGAGWYFFLTRGVVPIKW